MISVSILTGLFQVSECDDFKHSLRSNGALALFCAVLELIQCNPQNKTNSGMSWKVCKQPQSGNIENFAWNNYITISMFSSCWAEAECQADRKQFNSDFVSGSSRVGTVFRLHFWRHLTRRPQPIDSCFIRWTLLEPSLSPSMLRSPVETPIKQSLWLPRASCVLSRSGYASVNAVCFPGRGDICPPFWFVDQWRHGQSIPLDSVWMASI